MYVIFQAARPHVALRSGDTLEEIGRALLARREPDLTVFVNRDGLSRGLDVSEQQTLDAHLRALRQAPSTAGAAASRDGQRLR